MLFRLLLIALSTQAMLAFSPSAGRLQQRSMAVDMGLSAVVDRRTVFSNAAAALMAASSAAILALPTSSQALNSVPADNEIVKEQRSVTDKLDINNAAVADYMQFPGMYPKIGGKIANNGPYKSVKDIYKLKVLTKEEISKIKEYEKEFTATESTGLDTMRGRDPYRRSFNK